MRIVVSGSHATGKSTLIGDFIDVSPAFEHWDDPFEFIDDSFDVPDAASLARQLGVSAQRLLEAPEEHDVVAERGPLDFVAYLMALDTIGRGEGGRARALVERFIELAASATRRVDVIAILPIEHNDQIHLGVDDDPELRVAMNEALLELVDDADLIAAGTRVIELTGDRATRLTSLHGAIVAHGAHQR